MMEKLRQWTGMSTANPTQQQQQQQARGNANAEERKAHLILKQQNELAMQEARLEAVNQRLQIATAQKKPNVMKQCIQERNALQQQIQMLAGQLRNLEETNALVAKAETQLEQVRLMESGAIELEHIQKETENINAEDIIDKYKESAIQTREFGSLLATPFDITAGYDDTDPETGLDADDEVQMLLERQADEAAASLPHVVHTMTSQSSEPSSVRVSNTKAQLRRGGKEDY